MHHTRHLWREPTQINSWDLSRRLRTHTAQHEDKTSFIADIYTQCTEESLPALNLLGSV